MHNYLVLGRPRTGSESTFVKPDAKADAHGSMTWGWRPLDWVPKSSKWKEWSRRQIGCFYIPRSEAPLLENSLRKAVVHKSVVDRMRDTAYLPRTFQRRLRSKFNGRRSLARLSKHQ